jgi:hypothetical protein
MALAAATLSNRGVRPNPLLVTAVNTPQSGWVVLSTITEPGEVFSAQVTQATIGKLADTALPIWHITACVHENTSEGICWYLAGTLDIWAGTPFALAVVLENPDPELVTAIGQTILESTLAP